MAKAKLTLPKELRQFANRYGADHAYWYVPEALTDSQIDFSTLSLLT
jgi:hypothetical protein